MSLTSATIMIIWSALLAAPSENSPILKLKCGRKKSLQIAAISSEIAHYPYMDFAKIANRHGWNSECPL